MDVDRWNKYINSLNPQSLVAHNFELSGPPPSLPSPFLITFAIRRLIFGQNNEPLLAFSLKLPQRCFLEQVGLHTELDLTFLRRDAAPYSWLLKQLLTEWVWIIEGRIHSKASHKQSSHPVWVRQAKLIVLKGPFVPGSYDSLC